MKLLHKYFSVWYNVVLNTRCNVGKASALADWKSKLRAWTAWRAYVTHVRTNREAPTRVYTPPTRVYTPPTHDYTPAVYTPPTRDYTPAVYTPPTHDYTPAVYTPTTPSHTRTPSYTRTPS